jgi:hypothetical protein
MARRPGPDLRGPLVPDYGFSRIEERERWPHATSRGTASQIALDVLCLSRINGPTDAGRAIVAEVAVDGARSQEGMTMPVAEPITTPLPPALPPLNETGLLILPMIVLLALVIAMPVILQLRDRRLFTIPYITWFLLQYGIGATVALVIVVLGLAGRITAEGVTGLLGSLIGYVLGSSSSRRSQDTDGGANSPGAGQGVAITQVSPNAGAAGAAVTIRGRGFGNAHGEVSFGSRLVDSNDIVSWSPTEVKVRVPAGVPAGPVRIGVRPAGASYQILSASDAFTAS